MIGVITSEKSGSLERMGMKLYIWMRPGLIRIIPLTTCGYQLMVLMPQKIPSGKGKRLIVLHAGNREEGLIDRCDLVFLAKAKDWDYQQEMNGPTFLNWFENQLMPALKIPSVIVLDNASYHNIKTEETAVPNFNQRKAVLQNYLSKHNIPFQPLEL
jgi:hypothetical protein